MSDIFEKIRNSLRRMGLEVDGVDIVHGQDRGINIKAQLSDGVRVSDVDDLDYRINRLEESLSGACSQGDRWLYERDLLESRVLRLNKELAESQEKEAMATAMLENLKQEITDVILARQR